MKKFVLIILCIFFLIEAYNALASMPVAVKITGCIESGFLFSEEIDFSTHKAIRTEKEARRKITPVDDNQKPVNLSSYEGNKIKVSGRLLPGDLFIVSQKNIKVIGQCVNKKETPENRRLSLKEQEKLAHQLYETMAKTDKWDIEAFIKLHRQIIEQCPDTKRAEESVWRLSNLYLTAVDPPEHTKIIELMEYLLIRYPSSLLAPDAKKRLLVSYKGTGNYQKMIKLYDEAFNQTPEMLNDPEMTAYLLEYAEALSKTENIEKACEIYKKILGFGDKIEDWLLDIAKNGILNLGSKRCKPHGIENQKMITEDRAQEIIWGLPEVKKHSKRIKSMGKRPFTRIDASPGDVSESGNFYIIYFGEDHGTHVVNIMTCYVNAYSERIHVYEPIFGMKYPLEQWRMMQQ